MKLFFIKNIFDEKTVVDNDFISLIHFKFAALTVNMMMGKFVIVSDRWRLKTR